MVRIWGGGIYEADLFYDICDELGILVWQDFPFACAVYPYHDEFVKNVKEEAIQNIKRIRHHPSLALWCGNNEIEQLFIGLMALSKIITPKKISKYKKSYKYMFEVLFPELIKQYDPKNAYWPSSPSNGMEESKGGIFNSNSPDKGDSHYWKVWHMGAPFSSYRKFDSRFMSEYGFESFPSMKTIAAICPPEQYDFYSPIMENHQKNRSGNKKIMKYMKRRFSIPEKFEQQVVLSQITHGEAMEYGVEHWRRNRNNYHCMGSLYWQLNDCWQVASWASLDYYCRWKALHYYAKRFYNPIFPSVKESKKIVEFWLTNALRTSINGMFEWKILNSDGKMIMNGNKNTTILPCSSKKIDLADVSSINKDKGMMKKNIIFYSFTKDSMSYRGFRLFDAPKYFPLKNPDISHSIETVDRTNMEKTSYKLTIKAKQIALYVHVESNAVDFVASDNYFALEPGESRVISLRIENYPKSGENISEQELIKSFQVKSLFDLRA